VTALQKVAIGLVIVAVTASFGHWDALPDPVGWGFVVAGLLALRGRISGVGSLVGAAAVAGAAALVVYPPVVHDGLAPVAQWALSLPQTVFCLVLCHALAPYAGDQAGQLRGLRWAFAVIALLPAVVLGGGVAQLALPTVGLAFLSLLYLIVVLFVLARRAPFAGPREAPGAAPEPGADG